MRNGGTAPAVVTGRLVMFLQASPEFTPEVEVELAYDPLDPYAVTLTFHLAGDPSVRWVFARDLLLDGLSGRCGEGDIVVEPVVGLDRDFPDVRIRLRSPAGEAVLHSPALPLVAFLGRTDQALPLGREQAADDLDAELEQILNGRFRSAG